MLNTELSLILIGFAKMFHLLQRCGLQLSLKMAHLQGFPQLRRYKVFSPFSAENISTVLRKPQDVNWPFASASITKAQSFHSSCSSWKKKKPREAEPRELPPLLRDILSLKNSPKPALYLGFAGLIPFISLPLIMIIQKVYYPELAFAQLTYGASILSFLGGMRWGFALPENSPAKPDWINLANSIVPPLFAWLALLWKDDLAQAAMTIIIGLGIALFNDLVLLPTYPSWFKGLRTVLTTVAACSFVLMICIGYMYPEKHLFPVPRVRK
uniref:Transmembrane protein 69 n=1 Tax=Salvator merianae TaxID=96440 RepID=A0A8D0KJX1_SALMN